MRTSYLSLSRMTLLLLFLLGLASCCCLGGLDGDEFSHDDDILDPGYPHSEGRGGDV